jgi:hypothetical protein
VEDAVGPVHVPAAEHHAPLGDAAEGLQQAEGVGLEVGDHVDHHLRPEPPQFRSVVCEVVAVAKDVLDLGGQIGVRPAAVEDGDLVTRGGQPTH